MFSCHTPPDRKDCACLGLGNRTWAPSEGSSSLTAEGYELDGTEAQAATGAGRGCAAGEGGGSLQHLSFWSLRDCTAQAAEPDLGLHQTVQITAGKGRRSRITWRSWPYWSLFFRVSLRAEMFWFSSASRTHRFHPLLELLGGCVNRRWAWQEKGKPEDAENALANHILAFLFLAWFDALQLLLHAQGFNARSLNNKSERNCWGKGSWGFWTSHSLWGLWSSAVQASQRTNSSVPTLL